MSHLSIYYTWLTHISKTCTIAMNYIFITCEKITSAFNLLFKNELFGSKWLCLIFPRGLATLFPKEYCSIFEVKLPRGTLSVHGPCIISNMCHDMTVTRVNQLIECKQFNIPKCLWLLYVPYQKVHGSLGHQVKLYFFLFIFKFIPFHC